MEGAIAGLIIENAAVCATENTNLPAASHFHDLSD